MASSKYLSTARASTTERLRTTGGGLLVMAVVVGIGAAAFAVVFRLLISTFTRLLTGHADYAAVPGVANPHLPGLGRWFVLVTPVLAGLVYGPLVQRFAREARGHGVPEVMYAVAKRGGRIAPQVAGVKALASALCIGGGGSVGREGPIVQIGSALGSTLGRIVKVAEPRMRVLVACGAAGGIAATFNAPLAGVFFAMELILADFVAESFGMVVVAAVTASAIGRALLGNETFLKLPTFTVDHWQQYLLFALLGVLAGGAGVGFTKVLYAVEDGCDAVWRGPEWLRPAAGGLLLGLLLVALPEMYGVGYPVLGHAIDGRYAVGFLVVLLVGKMFATSLTIGIGGSGGVFAPSLFIGAMLGSAFGAIANDSLPGIAGAAGAYGLVGMGAVFASSSRAPITAVVILFELTGEYSIILPLMTAIVLATGISHRLSAETIYSAKLMRRGVDLGRRETIEVAGRTVGQVMGRVPDPVPIEASLATAAGALARAAYGVLPVVDDEGAIWGVLTARAVADALSDTGADSESAAGGLEHPLERLVEVPVTLRIEDSIEAGISALDRSGGGAVPVLADASQELVGWFDYRMALGREQNAAPPTTPSALTVGPEPT